MTDKPTSRQIEIAAEAITTAQLARCGWDVLVQYGAHQPEFDMVAVKGEATLRVSVKGSQDGGWGLTQSFVSAADYHGAIDRWLAKHSARTVLCFVQFKGIDLSTLPRLYLARPSEVAVRLRETASGRGDSILYEDKSWGPRAFAAGTAERIPQAWRFTSERLDLLAAEPKRTGRKR